MYNVLKNKAAKHIDIPRLDEDVSPLSQLAQSTVQLRIFIACHWIPGVAIISLYAREAHLRNPILNTRDHNRIPRWACSDNLYCFSFSFFERAISYMWRKEHQRISAWENFTRESPVERRRRRGWGEAASVGVFPYINTLLAPFHIPDDDSFQRPPRD